MKVMVARPAPRPVSAARWVVPGPDVLASLYWTSKWRRHAKAFRRMNPRCVAAVHRPDCSGLAEVVDHIRPRSTARTAAELQALTWDRRNWQSLSKRCHDAKTRSEQGWGRNTTEGLADSLRPVANLSPTPSAVITADYTDPARSSVITTYPEEDPE